MNKYVKLATVATTAVVMGMSSAVLAESPVEHTMEIRLGGQVAIDQDGVVDAEALAQLNFKLSETAKASLTVDLVEMSEGLLDDDFDLDDAIDEAKVSFDVDSLGRLVVAVKMDIDRINMSVLNTRESLEGEGMQGVAAIRLHMKSSYLEGLVVTVSKKNDLSADDADAPVDDIDGPVAANEDAITVSARAAKVMGMVTVAGDLSYTFNDVDEDTYAATAAVSIALDQYVNGLEAVASSVMDQDGLSGWSTGLNQDFGYGITAGALYEEQGDDEQQIRVGVSKLMDNGNTLSGSVGMNMETKAKDLIVRYEVPLGTKWRR